MPRGFYKHKLLLDEGFHRRTRLPILNSRFDVKHVAADFHLDGLSDPDVYDLARKEHRLLVTYNQKDFRELATRSQDTGVIGVSPNLPLEHIDKKLTALLTKATEKELLGIFTAISDET